MNENNEEMVEKSIEDTKNHIDTVYNVAHKIIMRFMDRIEQHDRSKLAEPEKTMFAKHGQTLKEIKYGTTAYEEEIEKMKKDCLFHHYQNNAHHPEHYKNGIEDMDLFDITEMLCDWRAASLRDKNGSFKTSLAINMDRFQVPQPLKAIILRSERYFYPYYLEIFKKDTSRVEFSVGFSSFNEFIEDLKSEEEDWAEPLIDFVKCVYPKILLMNESKPYPNNYFEDGERMEGFVMKLTVN